METMLSFHNKKEIKSTYIAQLKAHQKADEIVKGIYWGNGKGCAVGCTIHGSDHSRYEDVLGIPRIIARLEDRIFEGLPNEDAKKFPLQFLKAVPVGVDLSKVGQKFLLWLISGVVKYTKKNSSQYEAIKEVIRLYESALNGGIITQDKWITARRNAAAAAAAAAYAAAADDDDAADAAATYAAAAAAAAAAADAAATYAAAAAAAAADDAADDAADAAREQSFKRQAKKLIQLLKDCK